MSSFRLSLKSLKNLAGVHSDLVRVVARAIDITEVDFTVHEGLRTPERQKRLYDQGRSKTMNSRHLDGTAVDLWALDQGKVNWLKYDAFRSVADAMKQAATELGVKITWGGDWIGFKDLPHYQLEK